MWAWSPILHRPLYKLQGLGRWLDAGDARFEGIAAAVRRNIGECDGGRSGDEAVARDGSSLTLKNASIPGFKTPSVSHIPQFAPWGPSEATFQVSSKASK